MTEHHVDKHPDAGHYHRTAGHANSREHDDADVYQLRHPAQWTSATGSEFDELDDDEPSDDGPHDESWSDETWKVYASGDTQNTTCTWPVIANGVRIPCGFSSRFVG